MTGGVFQSNRDGIGLPELEENRSPDWLDYWVFLNYSRLKSASLANSGGWRRELGYEAPSTNSPAGGPTREVAAPIVRSRYRSPGYAPDSSALLPPREAL